MIKRLLIALPALFLAMPAFAVEESYAGVQFAQFEYDQSGLGSADPTMVVGRFGGSVDRHFGFEARLGLGLSGDSLTIDDESADVDIDYLVGGYGIARLPIAGTITPYGIAGVTLADLSADADAIAASGTETSLSWGIGVEASVTPVASVSLEYMQYFDDSAYDITALSLGFRVRF